MWIFSGNRLFRRGQIQWAPTLDVHEEPGRPLVVRGAAFGVPFSVSLSSYIPAGGKTVTTGRLTPPGGKSGVDFQAGYIGDDINPLPIINLAADKFTEIEFAIKPISAVVQIDDIYEFRITAKGALLDTYSQTPQWAIGEPPAPPSGTSFVAWIN